jgi:hypothetical protein
MKFFITYVENIIKGETENRSVGNSGAPIKKEEPEKKANKK